MKNFKRVAVLSMLAIAFTLGTTSCGKHRVKKDLDGSWTLNSVEQNGVDIYAAMGGSMTGTWTFDKKAKECNNSMTLTLPGSPAETASGTMMYTIEDKETILLDAAPYKIQEVTDTKLILTVTDGGDVMTYNFTK